MKKAENVKEFVERIDNAKKKNPKDLSSDQDLTIAIMNLISIEEHLIFSGAKTGKNSFYDMVQDIREMRKNLMLKIIPSYEGEVWCISKHLLATSMRLMEVGTKQQSMGNTEEAYSLFNQAYDLYCLFWGLNMNLIDLTGVQKIAPEAYAAAAHDTECKLDMPKKGAKKTVAAKDDAGKSTVKRLGAWVKNAVNCCIE